MSFAEKLRAARERKGVTQQAVADALNIDKTTYCGYETGKRKPDVIRLKDLSRYLGVSGDYLLETGHDHSGGVCMAPYHPSHRIPVLGRISAGLPLYAEEQVEGYTCTDLDDGGEYFALRVSGDSMTAMRIYDGDLLIVRRQDAVDNGQIAVVMVNGDEATVKRFSRDGPIVTLYPQSLNPAHLPQVYDLRQTPVRVIGLVVKIEISL